MTSNFTLKDLTDISKKVDICTVADKFVISAYTNVLEGEVNAYIRIDSCENETLGGTVLFSFRNGEQICLSDLTYDQQLKLHSTELDRIKEALSVSIEVYGQKLGVWTSTIDKINAKHNEDTNHNFVKISKDLPVPEFKYEEVVKEEVKKVGFFTTILNKLKKKKEV